MADTITIRTSTERDVVKIVERGPQGPAGGGGGGGSGTVTSVALAGTGLSITGSPLTTSGTITANVTYGTTAGTACEGNDPRIAGIESGAISTDGASINAASAGFSVTTGNGTGQIITNDGGSIDTSSGGGSITTNGTGSIELGEVGTRTTLTGTATANRAISLPDAAGTLALTSDITKSAVGLGNVTNNAQTQAAIVPNTAPSAGQLLVGNAGGTAYAPASVSGDATLSSTGALTLANTSTARTNIGLGNVQNVDTTNAANISSGVLPNARVNWAAPSAIGSTTAAAITGTTGAFTTLTATPAANTTALTSTGYSLTGSNAQSLVDLAGTWNTTGTPTALKLNVTNTASNTASLLLDLQTGGTSRVSVRQDGRLNAQTYQVAGNTVIERVGGFNTLNASCIVGWGGTGFSIGTTDLNVERDAADVMAQRRSTNSQESRLYGTFTSSTNYQRMTIKSVRQTLSALSGASATTTGTFIPDGAVVVGVTTRVATTITGATGYQIGDGTDADRWGDITGTAIGTTSDNINWTAGTIECFTAGGNVTLTAKTANFTAGSIEICVFYLAGEAD